VFSIGVDEKICMLAKFYSARMFKNQFNYKLTANRMPSNGGMKFA
jgi:hypothetical protein